MLFEVKHTKTEGLFSLVLTIIFGLFVDPKTDILLKRFTLNRKKMLRKNRNRLQFYKENPLEKGRIYYVNRNLARVQLKFYKGISV